MCVFWEGGRGDAQGPPATLQLTSKGYGSGGSGGSWGLGGGDLGCPGRCSPPPPRREGVSFGLLAEGAGKVVVILAGSWKINLFPLIMWQQLLPQSSSSSKWG